MVTNDATILRIKHDILYEVAKLAWNGQLADGRDDIPYKVSPGPQAQYRCCVYKEREIVRQRVRLAEGKCPSDRNTNNVVQVINAACEECPIASYTVTDNCRKCMGTVSYTHLDVYKRQLDTFVAFLAAFAIVPVVFATLGADGLGMGGGFAFMALPEVFDGMPGGRLFGLCFFILLFLAALTSAISILESCVAYITEEWGLTRKTAVAVFSVPMAVFSAGYSLSQLESRGINLPWFDFSNGLKMLPMNAVMEKFTDNLMIPLGALFFCIFAGWVWGSNRAAGEIRAAGWFSRIWQLVCLLYTSGTKVCRFKSCCPHRQWDSGFA